MNDVAGSACWFYLFFDWINILGTSIVSSKRHSQCHRGQRHVDALRLIKRAPIKAQAFGAKLKFQAFPAC
jgi:hypothetical protein